MRFTFDGAAGRLTVGLDSLDGVEGFFERAESQDGFLAELPEALPRGREIELTVTAPGGFEIAGPATVLHVFGGHQNSYATALELGDWGAAKRAELRRKLEAARSGGADGGGEAGESGAGGEGSAGGETFGASPIHRIRAMTPPQKARLARKANRTERQILLRETSPQVMTALLQNPHVDSDDVLQMVKSPYAPSGILKRVAGDRRWTSNHEVRLALVRNPQTPPPLANRLLPGLPTRILQKLARGGETREDLKKTALKLYLKRMGRG